MTEEIISFINDIITANDNLMSIDDFIKSLIVLFFNDIDYKFVKHRINTYKKDNIFCVNVDELKNMKIVYQFDMKHILNYFEINKIIYTTEQINDEIVYMITPISFKNFVLSHTNKNIKNIYKNYYSKLDNCIRFYYIYKNRKFNNDKHKLHGSLLTKIVDNQLKLMNFINDNDKLHGSLLTKIVDNQLKIMNELSII